MSGQTQYAPIADNNYSAPLASADYAGYQPSMGDGGLSYPCCPICFHVGPAHVERKLKTEGKVLAVLMIPCALCCVPFFIDSMHENVPECARCHCAMVIH
eukprot:TRINITY_DN12961_c4_g1_i1.p2 TRINITY_DN12961_c4_g1~~TRINITY_DN12961_c4_g1_i1.p2  ORF type:complete len:100 (-),score=21.29 TRINITY_DN12961_c4_g1_i1:78-377(-)